MSLGHWAITNNRKNLESLMRHLFGKGIRVGGSMIDQLVEKKTDESFNNKMVEIVNTISDDPEESNTVGSASYAAFKYPSDIDLFSVMNEYAVTKEKALDQFQKKIQNIIRKVTKTKGFYFSDFKCGSDERYFWEKDSKAYFEKYIFKLLKDRLITDADYKELLGYLKYFKIKKFREKFKELIKKKYITIRWKPTEVAKGYKILAKNKRVTLKEYMNQPGIIKLDVVTYLNTRIAFIECSNFMILKYKDNYGVEHYLNIPEGESMEKYLTDSILYEMRQLINPESKNYNTWKFSKRLYALAAMNKDEKVLRALKPLVISSNLPAINQIAADMETIIMMIQKVHKPPVKQILSVIDNFKPRLSVIQNQKLDKEKVYEAIDNILQAGKYNTQGGFVHQLEELHDYLKDIIKEQAQKWTDKHHITQIAKEYLG